MLTLLDGNAAMARTVASLRAACDLLNAGIGAVTAVSLSGRLEDDDRSLAPVLSAAERLATEYDFVVTLRLEGRAYQVRFSRSSSRAGAEPVGAPPA